MCSTLNISSSQTLCQDYSNIPHTVTLSGTYNTNQVYGNVVILVNGDCVFNKGLSISGCKIKMAPNARIIFGNTAITGKSIAQIMNSKIFSSTCSAMHNGIRVEAPRHLRFEGNEIEDGITGLTIVNGSSFQALNNKFNRDFKGIRLINGSNYPSSISITRFSNNTFSCSSPMNQSINFTREFQTTNNSYVGVEVNNIAIKVNLGLSPSTINVFKDLHIGIYAYHSSLMIENCQFKNMKQLLHPIYTDYPIAGYGVLSENQSIVEIKGIGNSPISANTFEDCDVSSIVSYNDKEIKINKCKTRFSRDLNVQIQNKHNEVEIRDGKNLLFQSIDNTFEVIRVKAPLVNVSLTNNLMLLENCIFEYDSKIKNCKFYEFGGGQDEGHLDYLIGLNIKKCLIPDIYRFYIDENLFNRFDYHNIILNLESSKNFVIGPSYFNTTEFLKTNNVKPSIFVNGGSDHEIGANNIFFDHNLGDENIGIRITGSTNNFLCNNSPEGMRTGVQVEGSPTGLMVAQTHFKDTRTGLWYVNGATTMYINKHRANDWAGTFLDKEARHDGGTFRFNAFWSKRNNYNMTSTKFWPSPLYPDNNNWFIDRSGFENEDLEGCVNRFNNSPTIGQFDPYLNDDFDLVLNPTQQWDAYKGFYTTVINNNMQGSLDSLTPVYNYIINQTNVPTFVTGSELIDNIYSISSTDRNALDVVQSNLNLLFTDLREIDSLININADDEDTTLTEQRALIINTISNVQVSLDSIWALIHNQQASNASAAMNAVNNLPAVASYELEEKFAMQMKLKKLIGSEYTVAEVSELYQIATQCINDHGNIVLLAQSLLPDSLQFYRNTLMFCNNQAIQGSVSNRVKKADHSISIYPQPITDFIILDGDLHDLLSVSIYSLQGGLIRTFSKDEVMYKRLNLNSITHSGLYTIVLEYNDGSLIHRKFIKE